MALREAEARAAALGEHHESAVERANELVRLEGELAAAREQIERAERDRVSAHQRADAAEHRLGAFRERAETAERELRRRDARRPSGLPPPTSPELAALRRGRGRGRSLPPPAPARPRTPRPRRPGRAPS